MSVKDQRFTKFAMSAVAMALASAMVACNNSSDDSAVVAAVTIANVEFVGMAAPSTAAQRADLYTAAKVKLTYSDNTSTTSNLAYTRLFATTDVKDGDVVGGVYDATGNPLMDVSVPATPTQYVADTPDANSLLAVSGANASALGVSGNPLFLVTHYEYVTANNAGASEYGQLPMNMSLAVLDQNKTTGALSLVKYSHLDMSGIDGLWIPCAGSLSPWNTHLGSEEYEPDARAFELDATKPPHTPFTVRYFNSAKTANPYSYGHVPEVTVGANGTATITKHYALGRLSRELLQMMPDGRTGYMGDDGSYTGLFMFVADTANDLSAGTLYAAQWNQTSDLNGGTADLVWLKLGHATDAEVKAMIDSGTTFSAIFLSSLTDPGDPTYKKVRTDKGTEWLKLQTGKEQAAAFLETRRYAAYLGATTEFNKMEGVTVNATDNKLYMAISSIDKGMLTNAADPADHIHVAKLSAGGVYQLALAAGQKDAAMNVIDSQYVATTMSGYVLGEDLALPDAVGNKANDDKIANPDNIKYSASMRTLFIGEDSGLHVNNYVWAYNIDTQSLARILSVPAGAEATGLQVAENMNGFTYIMSNFQHPGDYIGSMDATLMSEVDPLINTQWNNKKKAAIGYLSGMPVVK